LREDSELATQRKIAAFAILGDFAPRFPGMPSPLGAATAGQGIDIHAY
jgi:hypothetical protein